VGIALLNRLAVGAGAVAAGVDELEIAAPNGFGACVVVNGDDTVAVDVKLKDGLGAEAEDMGGPVLSVVAGFEVFNPLKRPALAGAVVLGANALFEVAPVPELKKLLDWVVAGLVAESEGLRLAKRPPEEG